MIWLKTLKNSILVSLNRVITAAPVIIVKAVTQIVEDVCHIKWDHDFLFASGYGIIIDYFEFWDNTVGIFSFIHKKIYKT